MADRKISDLTALTTPASGDFLPIVDISEAAAASKNKRITIEELFRGVPLGTAAAPSIAIEGDEDTGVFSPGANQLAISTNGVGRVEFGTSEVVFNDGGANYDFRIEGDTNANLFFVDASTDRVGLGTSSPSSLFHLQTTSANVVLQMLENNGSTVYGASLDAFNSSGGNFRIRLHDSGGTYQERFRITSTGNVGIGTTSPTTTLDVNGDVTITDKIIHGGDTNTAIRFPAADTVSVETGGSERARIDSSGRLLIGTSSARSNFFNTTSVNPRIQFEATDSSSFSVVSGDSIATRGGGLLLCHQKSGTIGGDTALASGDSIGFTSFQGSDGSEFVESAKIEAFVDGTPGANDMPGRLVFSTTADGAATPTERLRITSAGVLQVADAGNITVGTTTGTKIGTATTQKLGFYDKTPVVQPIAVADATDAASAITQLNALLARMRDLGLIAT